MRDIISAVIIDSQKEKHDYSVIKTEKVFQYDETDFQRVIRI